MPTKYGCVITWKNFFLLNIKVIYQNFEINLITFAKNVI